MNKATVIDRLFKAFKDSHIYTTLKTGRVKIRSGATYGDWAEIGRVIDPKAHRPIEVAEDFMYNNRKAAKELRTRIAEWRKKHPDPVDVLYIDGACAESLELKEFSLAGILNDDDVRDIKDARADNFMGSANNVEVRDVLKQTIVTYFDHDGAAVFYIGTNFVGPRDII